MIRQEVERTYEVDGDFAMPRLTRRTDLRTVEEPTETRLEAVYYDTDRFDLSCRGVVLWHLTGGPDAAWHLQRASWSGTPTELTAPSTPDREQPSAEFDQELRALVRGRSVRPIVRITTHRMERLVTSEDGRVVAEVADDRVSAQATAGTRLNLHQWRELGVELVDDGPSEVLDLLEEVLLANGARSSTNGSKVAQVLPGRVPASHDAGPWSEVAAYAQAQRDAIISLDPAVRRDEPGAVHKMRVACRRLRSTLRTFRPALDIERSEPLREELRWLAGELAAARDAEVTEAALLALVNAEPAELVIGTVAAQIRHSLDSERLQARRRALTALDDPRYTALLDAVDDLVDAPPKVDVTAAELKAMTRKALRRVDRRLAKAYELSASTPPARRIQPPLPGVVLDRDTQLHEARKAAKRARYAAEALQGSGGKPARRLVKELKKLQNHLGAHQDTVAARRVLRDLGVRAHLDGQNAFTYGLLHARQQAAAETAQSRIPRAHEEIRRKKTRAWLG
ncbi:CYTH and CHAD domain-containing protein [Actinopolymorpha singaporensis]